MAPTLSVILFCLFCMGVISADTSEPGTQIDSRGNTSAIDHASSSKNETNDLNVDSSIDSQTLAQVNVIQLYVVPSKRKKRLRAFDHLAGCPNDALQFVRTTNFDPSLKRHVFRTAFAVSAEECANLCHTHFFCRSAGFEPTSNRCLLSYKRSVSNCDWSSINQSPEPSLVDDIRSSDWWLGKSKGDQEQNGFDNDENDEEVNDVWLDCDRCETRYPEKFGRNETRFSPKSNNGTTTKSLPKHESSEFDKANFSRNNNESKINVTHFDNSSSSSLNNSSIQPNNSSSNFSLHVNETDAAIFNLTKGNETNFASSNITHSNDTDFSNTTSIRNETRLESEIANVSINETWSLLNATADIDFWNASRIDSNSTLDNSTATTWHPNGNWTENNSSLQNSNSSLHSNLTSGNASEVSENEHLQTNLSLANSTLTSNSTFDNGTTANLTTTHQVLENATFSNATSDPFTLFENATLENSTIDNSTLHSNLTQDNSTTHNSTTSNVTRQNATTESPTTSVFSNPFFQNMSNLAENSTSIFDSQATINSTWQNLTLHSNLTSDNSSLFNSTSINSTFDHTFDNSTSGSNLTFDNSTSHASNLTGANTSQQSDLTKENSTLHFSNETLENNTLHLPSSNQTLENASSIFVPTTILPIFNATSVNVTENDGNTTKKSTSDHQINNSTSIDFVPFNTSATPPSENGTVYPLSTRRARKFTRRPFTRHVEIVGNFSSEAASFVGGEIEDQ